MFKNGEYDWVLKHSITQRGIRVTIKDDEVIWLGTPYAIGARACVEFHGDMFFPVAR